MDSMPLSLLLDEFLLQNGQVNWVDALSSSSSDENGGYTNAISTDSPQLPYSSSEAQDDNDDYNDNKDDSLSPRNSNDDDGKTQKKRKRQEVKSKCEAKRRNRFNEQLEVMRSLLSASQKKEGKTPKMTRELLMSSAIQEILQLRQSVLQMNQMLVNTQQALSQKMPEYSQQALADPFNRDPYSVQDLERAFSVMFQRQLVQNYSLGNAKRTDDIVHEIRMLEDVTKQIGKVQHQLAVAVMEQGFYAIVKFTPKLLAKLIERNWTMYQNYQRVYKEQVRVLGCEAGAWFLSDMTLLEYGVGNFTGFERVNATLRDFLKKLADPGTNHYILASQVATFRGSISLSTAKRIKAALEGTVPWGPIGKAVLGTALISNGQPKEGLDCIEQSISEMLMLGQGKDSIHLFMAPALLDAYITTRSVEKGIGLANYVLKKYQDNNIETYLGKSELLRQKANLLILKHYPDFVPEPQTLRDADFHASEIVSLCETQPKVEGLTKPSFGPLPLPPVFIPESPDTASDDIELTLRMAMNLAHTRGLYAVELRCAIDLTRFFLHIGDINQAMDLAPVLKDCVSKVKSSSFAGELQRAIYIITRIDPTYEYNQ